MKQLQISDTLSLPLDAGTQTFACIGRKGSGKTFCAGKIAELLIGAGIQVVILDTVGNWYGLRLNKDGKSAGMDVAIIGGLRGDIPLEPTAGELIADVVVDTRRSIIIDASQFSKADRQRFAFAFGERLWKKKKAEHDPTPVHLILEESQLIVPQIVMGDAARMVGIYEEIIRLGRNYGIGVMMITQRPQSVNKEVLNQTECLMVFQVNGAQERKALKEWIVNQGMDVGILNDLPSLKPGECYVWSPQWLSVLKKVKILPKTTFDSTSTPKTGGTFRGKDIKPIDLADLQEKMKNTIEKAKADDPRELRKRIAELERKGPSMDKEKEAGYLEQIGNFKFINKEHEKIITALQKALDEIATIASKGATSDREYIENLVTKNLTFDFTVRNPKPVYLKKEEVTIVNSNGSLPKMEREILRVLAQRNKKSTKSQIGILSGYSSKSGSFSNALSGLRTKGYIHGGPDDLIITKEGLRAVGRVDPYPTGILLHSYWISNVGKMEGTILQVLIDAYPNGMYKAELGSKTGYSHESGSFSNALSKLRTLELIKGSQELVASDTLFEN